jgi:hypothetical protein
MLIDFGPTYHDACNQLLGNVDGGPQPGCPGGEPVSAYTYSPGVSRSEAHNIHSQTVQCSHCICGTMHQIRTWKQSADISCHSPSDVGRHLRVDFLLWI